MQAGGQAECRVVCPAHDFLLGLEFKAAEDGTKDLFLLQRFVQGRGDERCARIYLVDLHVVGHVAKDRRRDVEAGWLFAGTAAEQEFCALIFARFDVALHLVKLDLVNDGRIFSRLCLCTARVKSV